VPRLEIISIQTKTFTASGTFLVPLNSGGYLSVTSDTNGSIFNGAGALRAGFARLFVVAEGTSCPVTIAGGQVTVSWFGVRNA
jgi:hypothetical protein